MTTQPKRVRYRVFRNASIAVLAVYVINYVVTPTFLSPVRMELCFRPRDDLRFDSNRWKKATTVIGDRYRMVDDVLDRHLLGGLRGAEVKDLLGEPTGGDEDKMEKRQCYYYRLGSQKDFPASSIFFPWRFQNVEVWTLAVCLQHDRVYAVNIKVD